MSDLCESMITCHKASATTFRGVEVMCRDITEDIWGAYRCTECVQMPDTCD